MNNIFYDPQNHQVTIALTDPGDATVTHEQDGTVLINIENIEDIEFFWPDEKIWRAVK